MLAGDLVLLSLLGVMGTYFAPVLGALMSISMENYLAEFGAWVSVTQGVVFVVVVLAFRRGVIGELAAKLKVSL
jgi:branched-chain amino acid transport system permease protein